MTALFTLLSDTVKADWVDYNGHMGDYAYGIVFSDTVTAYMDLIGVNEAYRTGTLRTIYTLDMRIAYLQECKQGQEYRVDLQVLDADSKRVHIFCRMIDAKDGTELAVNEQLLMHMQQQPDGPPKPAVFPAEIQLVVDSHLRAHQGLAVPSWVGSRIGIRRKPA